MSTVAMTGGEAIARALKAHGDAPIFGMGGFQLLPFYDAARRLGLAHHLVNDERAGIFAADAYAKVSGRVGVVDATLGPGATNLVTGLVEALNAGTAIVAIVGDAHRGHSGNNMTQEACQVDLLRPAAKELITVTQAARLPELVTRAFAVATSGRPGPVVIDVPEDVSHAELEFDLADFDVPENAAAVPARRIRPDDDAVNAAASLIAGAKRPVLIAGGGVHLSGAAEEISRFAESLNMPVAHTMTGKGAVSCMSSLSVGLFGRYDRIANQFLADSDLVISVGCKLGEIATKRYTVPPPNVPMIHIDLLAEEFGRTRRPTLALWGDARATVSALLDALDGTTTSVRERQSGYAAEVAAAMSSWRQSAASRLSSDEVPINMARLVGEINRCLPPSGLLLADGGFAAHWAGLLFDTREAGRSFLTDRGFASIGYGVPGAIGACLAAPGRPVVALSGDGGFNMMMGELETARRIGVSPTIVIVDNGASGYVKALQHHMYGAGSYHASDLGEVRYDLVAEAMGCRGVRVDDPSQLADALNRAVDDDAVWVLDVIVTRDPARMLPGIDSRFQPVVKGDRIA